MSEPFVPTWRDNAVCRETDPEAFYPPRGGSARPAKRICGMCSVRADCLTEALSYPASEDYGIRGGLSERERIALRRQRAGRLAPVVDLPLPTVAERTDIGKAA